MPHVQDWGSVNVGRGSLNKASVPKTQRGIDAAKAAGKIKTETRYGAGGNSTTHTIMSTKKLDDATELPEKEERLSGYKQKVTDSI